MIWQGDFGTGQPTGSGIWSDPGANPCKLYGPIPVAGTTGQGIINPPFKVGMEVNGDLGADFVLGKLVLAAVTDLLPGQAYQYDKDFNLTLLLNATSVLNNEIGIAQVFGPNTPAGTYYMWVARAGHIGVQAVAGSVATGSGETTATAGALKFPAAATAGFKSISPTSSYLASAGFTFTANTVNGSPTLTNVSSITDLQLGASLAGAGLPANAVVAAIRKTGNTWAIDIGTGTATNYAVLQNCTATANAVVVTVTGILPCNVYWPTASKQN